MKGGLGTDKGWTSGPYHFHPLSIPLFNPYKQFCNKRGNLREFGKFRKLIWILAFTMSVATSKLQCHVYYSGIKHKLVLTIVGDQPYIDPIMLSWGSPSQHDMLWHRDNVTMSQCHMKQLCLQGVNFMRLLSNLEMLLTRGVPNVCRTIDRINIPLLRNLLDITLHMHQIFFAGKNSIV